MTGETSHSLPSTSYPSGVSPSPDPRGVVQARTEEEVSSGEGTVRGVGSVGARQPFDAQTQRDEKASGSGSQASPISHASTKQAAAGTAQTPAQPAGSIKVPKEGESQAEADGRAPSQAKPSATTIAGDTLGSKSADATDGTEEPEPRKNPIVKLTELKFTPRGPRNNTSSAGSGKKSGSSGCIIY